MSKKYKKKDLEELKNKYLEDIYVIIGSDNLIDLKNLFFTSLRIQT